MEPIQRILISPNWIAEPKLDGVRAKIQLSPIAKSHMGVPISRYPKLCEPSIFGRSGDNWTEKFPEIVQELASIHIDAFTSLEGEIIYLPDNNNIVMAQDTFTKAHQRALIANKFRIGLLSKLSPLTFIVFDITYYNGKNLRLEPLTARKRYLDKFFEVAGINERLMKIWYTYDKLQLIENVKGSNGEGVMLKNCSSHYDEGGWIKYKNFQTEDCIVTGFTKGEGSRESTFGALELSQYHMGELVSVGKCGSGFTEEELQEILKLPLPFVVEVRYLEREASLKLRHPSFLRLRYDKKIEECIIKS